MRISGRGDFDNFVERACAKFYVRTGSRSSQLARQTERARGGLRESTPDSRATRHRAVAASQ